MLCGHWGRPQDEELGRENQTPKNRTRKGNAEKEGFHGDQFKEIKMWMDEERRQKEVQHGT